MGIRSESSKALTVDVVVALADKQYKSHITQDFVDTINNLVDDPDYSEEFKQNFLSSLSILGNNGKKWSLEAYVNAVKYFSLTAAQVPQNVAYATVFPDRLQSRLDRGEALIDIRGEASRYNNSVLVNKIREQAAIPLHLVNQSNVQLAINVLADIAENGRNEVARVAAATALIKELRPPTITKLEIDLGGNGTTMIDELKKVTAELAQAQLDSILGGNTVKQIAESTIIDVEIDEA